MHKMLCPNISTAPVVTLQSMDRTGENVSPLSSIFAMKLQTDPLANKWSGIVPRAQWSLYSNLGFVRTHQTIAVSQFLSQKVRTLKWLSSCVEMKLNEILFSLVKGTNICLLKIHTKILVKSSLKKVTYGRMVGIHHTYVSLFT